MPFPEHTFKMDPGETLFLYTDGVPEATNTHNELFSPERMLAVLNEDPDAKPETILDNVLRNVDESVGDAEQFDDLTMLCFKYRHRSEDDEDA